MAESSFSYLFSELYKDVLEYQGQGRDSVDATALAKAKRRVNDAYRKFLCLDWQFLTKIATLTIESGKYEYELPDDYGVLRVPFKLVPNIGNQNPTETISSILFQARGFNPMTGFPSVYSFQTEYTKESGLRIKVVFYPTPGTSFSYYYEYKVLPNILVGDDDIPYCPANISHVLRAFCLAEVEAFDEEGDKTTWTNQLYQVLLPQAIKENSIRSPNTVGSMNVGFDMCGLGHPLYGNSININGSVYRM